MNENKEMEALEKIETALISWMVGAERTLTQNEAEGKINNSVEFKTIRLALTELAEIKKRAEDQRDKYKYAYTEGLNNDSVAKIIDFIINGEGEGK